MRLSPHSRFAPPHNRHFWPPILTGTVDVPTFDDAGQPAIETLLIGPASQITLSPAPEDELESDRDDFVEHLRASPRPRGRHARSMRTTTSA
jgi:hypothetical protein